MKKGRNFVYSDKRLQNWKLVDFVKRTLQNLEKYHLLPISEENAHYA